jgi:hypothetical protein
VWLQYSTETEVIWIGRWNHEQEVIVAFYRPIVAYVYTIHSLRVRLQMSKSLEVKHDELVGTWELSPYPNGPLYCNDGSYDI